VSALAAALAGCANSRARRRAAGRKGVGQRARARRAPRRNALQNRVAARSRSTGPRERWNGLRDPDVIRVGQRLRLTPPPDTRASSSAPAPASGNANRPSASRRAARCPSARRPRRRRRFPSCPRPAWAWPADGAVVARFGTGEGIATDVGIGGRVGQPVRAARRGPNRLRRQRTGRLRPARDHQAQRDVSDRVRVQQRAARDPGQEVARAKRLRRWAWGRSASPGCTSKYGATGFPSIRCSISRAARRAAN
jgi:hypothetical protein